MLITRRLRRNFRQALEAWFEGLVKPGVRPDVRNTEIARSKEAGVLYFVVYKFGPMRIEHLGVWVEDLEKMRQFYVKYFGMKSGDKYVNDPKGFTSYFLSFSDGKTRLELMNRSDVKEEPTKRGFVKGIAHFAISVGDKDAVNRLTERLRADNYSVQSEPRTTGDGYYESVVLDPEGNYIEITV